MREFEFATIDEMIPLLARAEDRNVRAA